MWSWFQANSDAISAAASVATLAVWSFYLHLIYGGYRRSRRSKILINRGAGKTLDASCIISNMSAEPIYLEGIRLSLEGEEEDSVVSLSDLDITVPEEGDRRSQWLQGPLSSSEMIDIGSFRSLIHRGFGTADSDRDQGQAALDGRSFTIVVVATLTSEDKMVAAERRFQIRGGGQRPRLHAYSLRTHQVRSGQARKAVEQNLERELQQEWRAEA